MRGSMRPEVDQRDQHDDETKAVRDEDTRFNERKQPHEYRVENHANDNDGPEEKCPVPALEVVAWIIEYD